MVAYCSGLRRAGYVRTHLVMLGDARVKAMVMCTIAWLSADQIRFSSAYKCNAHKRGGRRSIFTPQVAS